MFHKARSLTYPCCLRQSVTNGRSEVLDIMCLLINLGFQVLFISQNVHVPLGDGLLLTHPDLLCHLGGEKEVTFFKHIVDTF